MSRLAATLLSALAWAALLDSFAPPTLLAGAALGILLVSVGERIEGRSGPGERLVRILRFLGRFSVQVVRSNLRVAHDVATRAHRSSPGILGVPLRARTDLEIALLANLISLTPGTLSLDVSDDRRTLWIHAMFAEDPEEIRREIRDQFETPLLEILR